MSDPLRLIRNECVAIENMLGSLGATGSGLGEKAASLEGRFNQRTARSLRQIAALRNRVMHEGYEPTPEDMEKFWRGVNHTKQTLTNLGAQASGQLMDSDALRRHEARRAAEATEQQLEQEKGNHTLTRGCSYVTFLPFCYLLLSGVIYRMWQANEVNMGLFACLLTVALLGSFVLLERAYYGSPNAADKLGVMRKYNVYAVMFWAGVLITAFALFLNG